MSIRRDVDEGDFQFPDKEPLMLRLRDMLEPAESVDEKYYLSTEREGVRRLIAELEARYSLPTAARIGETPVICQVGNIIDNPNRDSQCGRIYGPSGIAPTLNTVGGGGHEAKVVIDGLTRDTQKQKARVFNPPGLAARIGETPVLCQIGNIAKDPSREHIQDRIYAPSGLAPTLTATDYKDPLKIAEPRNTRTVRIRKLTPRECWRLMGFLDEEFDRVHGISNSQLYKQAGNSIVVNVLSALLSQLFYKELV